MTVYDAVVKAFVDIYLSTDVGTYVKETEEILVEELRCPMLDRFCYDNQLGVYFWDLQSTDCSTRYIEIFYGQATRYIPAIEDEAEIVIAENPEKQLQMGYVLGEKPVEKCGSTAYSTQTESVFVILGGSRLPAKKIQPSQLDKLFSLESSLFTSIISQGIDRRAAFKKLTEQLCDNAMQTMAGNLVALQNANEITPSIQGIAKEGIMYQRGGAVTWMLNCTQVTVEYRQQPFCTNELSVWYLNASWFVDPLSMILQENSTGEIACTPEFPAKYKINRGGNDLWYCADPKIDVCRHEPQVLRPTLTSLKSYRLRLGFKKLKYRVYSKDLRDRHRRWVRWSNQRKAALGVFGTAKMSDPSKNPFNFEVVLPQKAINNLGDILSGRWLGVLGAYFGNPLTTVTELNSAVALFSYVAGGFVCAMVCFATRGFCLRVLWAFFEPFWNVCSFPVRYAIKGDDLFNKCPCSDLGHGDGGMEMVKMKGKGKNNKKKKKKKTTWTARARRVFVGKDRVKKWEELGQDDSDNNSDNEDKGPKGGPPSHPPPPPPPPSGGPSGSRQDGQGRSDGRYGPSPGPGGQPPRSLPPPPTPPHRDSSYDGNYDTPNVGFQMPTLPEIGGLPPSAPPPSPAPNRPEPPETGLPTVEEAARPGINPRPRPSPAPIPTRPSRPSPDKSVSVWPSDNPVPRRQSPKPGEVTQAIPPTRPKRPAPPVPEPHVELLDENETVAFRNPRRALSTIYENVEKEEERPQLMPKRSRGGSNLGRKSKDSKRLKEAREDENFRREENERNRIHMAQLRAEDEEWREAERERERIGRATRRSQEHVRDHDRDMTSQSMQQRREDPVVREQDRQDTEDRRMEDEYREVEREADRSYREERRQDADERDEENSRRSLQQGGATAGVEGGEDANEAEDRGQNGRYTEEELQEARERIIYQHTVQNDHLQQDDFTFPLFHQNPIIEAGRRMFECLEAESVEQCVICKESYIFVKVGPRNKKCKRCAQQTRKGKKAVFDESADLNPSVSPQCLRELEPIEAMAIQMICPVMAIYKRGQTNASRGHCFCVYQDVVGFSAILPRLPQESGRPLVNFPCGVRIDVPF